MERNRGLGGTFISDDLCISEESSPSYSPPDQNINQPLVSIILPVYNSQDYLSYCLSSLSEQSYRNIEVLICDDGSDDRSLEIAKKHACNDLRFRVISSGHFGVSHARNICLDRCSGEFIMFVDSDDFVHPDFVITLLDTIMAETADIAVCRFKTLYSDYDAVSFDEADSGETRVFSFSDAIASCRIASPGKPHLYTTIWNKIFRASVIMPADRFDESYTFGEDTKWLFNIMMKSEKIAYIDRILYYYLKRKGKSYSSRPNKIRYYSWEADFFKDNNLGSDLVHASIGSVSWCSVLQYIEQYIAGVRYPDKCNIAVHFFRILAFYKKVSLLRKARIFTCLLLAKAGISSAIVQKVYGK